MLLVGTGDGVYRLPSGDATEGPERVLDCGRVVELAVGKVGAYAATRSGLFRTIDGGDTWTDLELPESDVWSVHLAGERVLAGCYPAALYASGISGWAAVEAIDEAPEAPRWYSPGDDDSGRVRTIRTVPGRPDRLLVGVEVGGLYVSDDGGESVPRRLDAVADDVHHVNVRGPDEYLVCCGMLTLDRDHGPGGLFRTVDGGSSWTRLDLGAHAYVRESLVHDGVTYVGGSRVTPGEWDDGVQGALLEAPGGGPFEAVPYPGEPREIVLAWAVEDGVVYGGTWGPDGGRLLRREPDGWTDAGRMPAPVFSLVAV